MRSFTHLDYLCLEIDRQKIQKTFMIDKSTQSDDELVTKQDVSVTETKPDRKQPPKRPPPPKLKSIDDNALLTSQEKSSKIENIRKLHREIKMKRKFQTLKERTSTFTRNFYKKLTIKKSNKSQSLCEPNTMNGEVVSDAKVTINIDETRNSEIIIPSTAEVNYRPKPMDQTDRRLNLKSAPPKIMKSVSSVIAIEDILSENDSIFSKFDIINLLKDYMAMEHHESSILDFDQYVDSCLNAFIKTCHFQITDTLNDLNDKLSHFLDLDSISLTSNQTELYIVHCIPGWKQIRIIEDNSTKEKYLSLKNSHFQSWIQINSSKTSPGQRWICFPIHSLNTFENEMNLSNENDFQNTLLKLIMLICLNDVYNDDKFPKNIDPNTILLVSSKCGILVIFKECLNESELFSLGFFGCNSIESISDVLLESKRKVQKIAKTFFQRPEVISILISSTWPLDYLALFLAELVIDNDG